MHNTHTYRKLEKRLFGATNLSFYVDLLLELQIMELDWIQLILLTYLVVDLETPKK